MYKNLITEMLINNITYKDIAEVINKHRETAKRKVLEINACFDLNEAKLIHKAFFKDFNFSYLFESTKKINSGHPTKDKARTSHNEI